MKFLNTYIPKCLKLSDFRFLNIWSAKHLGGLGFKYCLGFGTWGLGFLTRINDHIGYLYLRYDLQGRKE